MKTAVLASQNAKKARELAPLLLPLGWSIRPLSEFTAESAVEDRPSFVENALIKARFAAQCSGLPAIADDSGLAVDALGGAPGVHSARYAGVHGDDQANNARLLQALSGRPPPERGASFHCALVFVRNADDPVPLIAHGVWRGHILLAARGDNGFGYDPLFGLRDEERSAAELTPQEKAACSHRGLAVRCLLKQLQALA